MGVRISSAIILDKLRRLELGMHNDLREIGQIVQIDTSSGVNALHDTHLFCQGFHLTLDLAVARL